MNDPQAATSSLASRKPSVARFEDCVRRHPAIAVLAAVGAGLAVALVTRALVTPPPRRRAVLLLENLYGHLSDLTHSTLENGADALGDRAHAVGKGLANLGGLHLDRRLDKFSRRLKKLVH